MIHSNMKETHFMMMKPVVMMKRNILKIEKPILEKMMKKKVIVLSCRQI